MKLPARESSALILAAVFLLLGTLCVARGDNIEGAVAGQPSVNQSTGKEVEAKVVEQPPVKTTEPWEITVGGARLACLSQRPQRISRRQPIYKRRNWTSSQEYQRCLCDDRRSSKRRYGVNGGVFYLNAQADTGERSGLVSKVDLGYQQYFGQLFASYRVIEGPHGWLDLLAGFRYTYPVGGRIRSASSHAWLRRAKARPAKYHR